jgi:hypothetical protein
VDEDWSDYDEYPWARITNQEVAWCFANDKCIPPRFGTYPIVVQHRAAKAVKNLGSVVTSASAELHYGAWRGKEPPMSPYTSSRFTAFPETPEEVAVYKSMSSSPITKPADVSELAKIQETLAKLTGIGKEFEGKGLTSTTLRGKIEGVGSPEPTGDSARRVLTGMSAGQRENARQWSLIEKASPHLRRVLLYGPPGTGKSYLARTAGVKDREHVYPAIIHSDLPAAELRGHFIPTQEYENGKPIGNPILHWHDGPAIAAWRHGGRLVLDEIDKAGDDALSFLLAILDDQATAMITLGTTQEVIRPHANFSCWATMNGEPEDLPDPLKDRFTVSAHVIAPNPAAIAALPKDLQGLALTHATGANRIGLRSFMEFAELRKAINPSDAADLIFRERSKDIQGALRMAGIADAR